ncbi:MAG: DUF6125 family protein [Desulfatiglans sp.]|jgi:hypothetical protein|nr:DUF6125 family protein [Thermodesulfobacteriota bacterium]MEE4353807.1 DUF6125 family protein [Desulfatiglans sp.]
MLEDYSGEFNGTIEFEKFSREALVGLLKVYAKLYSAIDGFWYLSVKERIDDDEALACDMWVWNKAVKYELDRLVKVLKIEGKNVTSLMKALQMSPWFWVFKYNMDIDNDDHAILTITECPTLAALEKEGTGREKRICQVVEPMIFQEYADYFNPSIKVDYLEIPPRKNRNGICCRWEFTME